MEGSGVEGRMKNKRLALASTLISISISLVVASLFLVITSFSDYRWVVRAGGSGLLFLVSIMILRPIISSYYKRIIREPVVNGSRNEYTRTNS